MNDIDITSKEYSPFQWNTDRYSVNLRLGDFIAGVARKGDGSSSESLSHGYRHVLTDIRSICGSLSGDFIAGAARKKDFSSALHQYPTDIDMYWRPFQWNTDI